MLRPSEPTLVICKHPPKIIPTPIVYPELQLARGTKQNVSQIYEHPMGTHWLMLARLEQLSRNMAIAGALEMAYRRGLLHERQYGALSR
jgi:hypothetical protein